MNESLENMTYSTRVDLKKISGLDRNNKKTDTYGKETSGNKIN